MGALARVFWFGLSALFLATGLTLMIISATGVFRGDEKFAVLGEGLGCLIYAFSSFRIGSAHAWPGAWPVIRRFLFDTCLVTAAMSGLFLLTANPRPRGDTQAIGVTFLVFSLVFAFFFKLLPGRISRPPSAYARPGPPADGPGWGALGAILVTLGVSIALGCALLASGMGDPIIRGMGQEGAMVRDFVMSGRHLLVACALFLPGLFCILRSRQAGGGAHVLRGALGFTGAGLLVYILARTLPELAPDSTGLLRFTHVWAGDLIGLFSLGVLTALLLFWPARSIPASVDWRSEVRS